jgi:hypothetical protein
MDVCGECAQILTDAIDIPDFPETETDSEMEDDDNA